MTIETISSQNLAPLTRLTLALWERSDAEEELENWRTVLGSAQEICFLANNGEDYVGFIHLTIRNDYVEGTNQAPTAYVEALYVRSEARKLGVASLLLHKGEEWAKAKGLTQLASDTEIDNLTSIGFHLKVGFKEVNRVVCFVKDL
jgi:aminoglycoside 6'-N-acetyltransferase I